MTVKPLVNPEYNEMDSLIFQEPLMVPAGPLRALLGYIWEPLKSVPFQNFENFCIC